MRIKILIMVFATCIFIKAQPTQRILNPTSDEITKYEMVGGIIANKLTNNLKAELIKAIKEGGAIKAISVCNLKAIPLSSELTESNKTIVEIKRVSEKFRNPQNAPVELDLMALKYFEEKWAEPPKSFLQKIERNDSLLFNFYQPITVGSTCTTCHGSEEKIDAVLNAKIKELYPEDKATGYKVGDFRGVIKITFLEK